MATFACCVSGFACFGSVSPKLPRGALTSGCPGDRAARGVSPHRATERVAVPGVIATSGTPPAAGHPEVRPNPPPSSGRRAPHTSLNKLADRAAESKRNQSVIKDWPLWSGHFPASSVRHKVRSALSSGMLMRLGPFTSDERSRPSPSQKGERDSRPRASRSREQRDTRPRLAMNPRSPKAKHLRPMAVPPLFRTFRSENPDFARTDTDCSTTATNCFHD